MMSDWKFFVLGRDRTPLPNCPRCSWQSDWVTRHDPEECACLNCHGFYAGTSDPTALAEMARLHPANAWAVRTGRASGIVVLDVEGPEKDPLGYDTLERWADFTGFHLPNVTLQARSPSGGLHLYFAFPGSQKIASRNRILPGIDLKADGGYVVVPHVNAPGRRWERRGSPTLCSPEMVDWLSTARGVRSAGTSVGHAVDYDFARFLRDGCPEGAREEFFNDFLFRLRKRGVTQQDAYESAYEQWMRCQQPEGLYPGARWFWPWEHVEYKLRRIWATVEPNEVSEWQLRWLSVQQDHRQLDGETVRGPRRTIAPPSRWSDS